MPADGWLGASRVRLTRPGRGRRISLTGFPTRPDETTRPHLRPAPHRCSVLGTSPATPLEEQDEPIIGIPPHRSTVILKDFVLRRGRASPIPPLSGEGGERSEPGGVLPNLKDDPTPGAHAPDPPLSGEG